MDEDKNGEDVSKLKSVGVVLAHCNLVNNNYQQTLKVLFTVVPNKEFGQLINIAPHSLTMLGTTNTEFSFIEVWFTDKNSEPLEIEFQFDTNYWANIVKMRYSTQPKFRKYVKGYGFLSFARKFGDKYGKTFLDTTEDLIGNKIADKVTSSGKTKSKEKENEEQEIYISPEK